MRDEAFRALERAARAGDPDAAARLVHEEARLGLDVARFDRALGLIAGEVLTDEARRELAAMIAPIPEGWALRPADGPLLLIVRDTPLVTVGLMQAAAPELAVMALTFGRLAVEVTTEGVYVEDLLPWARRRAPDRVRELVAVVERWAANVR